MKIHVLTLFPEMIRECFKSSIMGRAAQKEILSLHTEDIRDHTLDKHRKVDDYPYGSSTRVVLPWSTWAMMATFLSFSFVKCKTSFLRDKFHFNLLIVYHQ